MEDLPTLLAQTRPALVRSAVWLWALLALLGIVVVAASTIALRARRRHSARARRARRRRRWIPSAWEEAGRRAEGITIDVDPPSGPGDEHGPDLRTDPSTDPDAPPDAPARGPGGPR